MQHLIYAKLDLVLRSQFHILRKLEANMAALDDLTTAVSRNTDVVASALVLINGFKAQLDAAGTDPAKLAALSASLATSDDALAAAVAANTPAAKP